MVRFTLETRTLNKSLNRPIAGEGTMSKLIVVIENEKWIYWEYKEA